MVRGFDLFGGGSGAQGTTQATAVNNKTIRITVTGLGFRPANIFGEIDMMVNLGAGWTGQDCLIVNDTMQPIIISGFNNTTFNVSTTYSDGGFVMTITSNMYDISGAGGTLGKLKWFTYGAIE